MKVRRQPRQQHKEAIHLTSMGQHTGPERSSAKQPQPRNGLRRSQLGADPTRLGNVYDPTPIGRHRVIPEQQRPRQTEKTNHPEHRWPAKVVQDKRPKNARQQRSHGRAGRQDAEETGPLGRAQILTSDAYHAGEMNSLAGPIEDPNSHYKRDRIAGQVRRRSDDIRHPERQHGPADRGQQNHLLAAKLIAQIPSENLRQRVTPEERAQHRSGVSLAPLALGSHGRHQQWHRGPRRVQHTRPGQQRQEPGPLLAPGPYTLAVGEVPQKRVLQLFLHRGRFDHFVVRLCRYHGVDLHYERGLHRGNSPEILVWQSFFIFIC